MSTLYCHETTVHFWVMIDRQSVLPAIFRGLYDVGITLKYVTFVTEEQNVSSLGPPERLKKLVTVQIRFVSLRHTHSHMYPWICSPLDVSWDIYLKDPVLLMSMTWVARSTF